jgi:murein DD-endopeptidase MepM/ murein hydrolase activator NlpD
MSAERIAAPAAPAPAQVPEARADQRTQLAKLAAEFESLLLANVLRDMRSAGRWSEEDSSDMLGASAFGQTFDTELARSLSQSGGFGLSAWLMKAFDRDASLGGATATGSMPPPTAFVPSAATVPSDAVATDVETALSIAGSLRPTAVTSPFGWRKDPLTGAMSFHRGVDLKAAEGDPVNASGDGRVVSSGPNGGYGISVVLEHANGVRTRYAHLSEALVTPGEIVRQGQSIGRAGQTGRATGPHVHYEVLTDGQPVDPLR